MEKLDNLRCELLGKQEAACGQLSKKIKRGKAYEFRRKGNEVQYNCVIDKLDGMTCVLEKASDRDQPEAVERAKKTLVKGKDLLQGRI